jgi:hypothetical protein
MEVCSMTDDQYKQGLLELIEIVHEIEASQTWDEVETLTDYAHSMLEQALQSLDNKRVLN